MSGGLGALEASRAVVDSPAAQRHERPLDIPQCHVSMQIKAEEPESWFIYSNIHPAFLPEKTFDKMR